MEIGKNNIPKYTLKPAKVNNDYVLSIGKNADIMLRGGKLTSIVWYIVEEFHSHDFWEICLVLRGNSVHRFPDRTESMRPGSVYLMRPHDVHYISPVQTEKPLNMQAAAYIHRDIYIPDEKMKRICAALRSDLYDELLAADRPLSAVLSADETNRLESSLNYFTSQSEDFEFMHTVIVSHILCSMLENRRYVQTEYPLWLIELLKNLDRESFMIKSMKEIVQSVNYNQSYICRRFKKFTGQTLVKYIHKRKCSYSLFLLSDSTISIAQIAERLAFSDESTYIRIFRQVYGATPGQWRKNYLNTLSAPSHE